MRDSGTPETEKILDHIEEESKNVAAATDAVNKRRRRGFPLQGDNPVEQATNEALDLEDARRKEQELARKVKAGKPLRPFPW